MRICIPVGNNSGLDSSIYQHFGSTPGYLVVDTESGQTRYVSNREQDHVHGACNPLMKLTGLEIDAVLVGGIGFRALTRLKDAGVTVYQVGNGGTAAEVLSQLRAGLLSEIDPATACSGHGRAGGCSH